MYVCLFTYNSGTGGAIICRFTEIATGCLRDDFGAGGQCKGAVYAGIDVVGPARILHMDTENGGLGRAKSKTGLLT